jgi:orotate phosphoribosyltransferase
MKAIFTTETERRGARARLRELIRQHSLEFGSFQLASGSMSHYYLDLRRTTTHPEGSYLTATLILDRLANDWPDAVGGPTLGADPLAGALAALSHVHGHPLPGFIVRRASKDHGMQRRIEGHLNPGARVILIDDVITRGGSLVRAAEIVREHGAQITRVMTILDRQAGGTEALARAGLTHEPLFLLDEIMTREELEGTHAPTAENVVEREPSADR